MSDLIFLVCLSLHNSQVYISFYCTCGPQLQISPQSINAMRDRTNTATSIIWLNKNQICCWWPLNPGISTSYTRQYTGYSITLISFFCITEYLCIVQQCSLPLQQLAMQHWRDWIVREGYSVGKDVHVVKIFFTKNVTVIIYQCRYKHVHFLHCADLDGLHWIRIGVAVRML